MKPEDVEVPPFFPDLDIIRRDILDYYWEVERFDRQVGEALALLETQGLSDNTIVVMAGDHGFPFPRGKANLYDHGARVPLAIKWHAQVPKNRVVTDFVSTTGSCSNLSGSDRTRHPAGHNRSFSAANFAFRNAGACVFGS